MKVFLLLSILFLTIAPIESPQCEDGVLERMEAEIAAIVGSARPLVVSIRADHREAGRSARWQRKVGSGVVLDSEGHILTAESVIRGAERIEVVAVAEKKYPAEPIGFDRESGLAVIRVKETGFQSPPYGDSDRVQIGRWTLVVGNSMGVVSAAAFGLITGFREGGRWIQINTRVCPGNGGAPLFDSKGRLIGIVMGELSSHRSDLFSPHAPASALAIPINEARRVARHLIAYGEITYGWLGVTAGPVNASAENPEIVVWQVARHSPAHKAGIRRGDFILRYKGRPVGSAWELAHRVRTSSVGEVVNLELRRADRRVSIPVRIGKKPLSGRARNFPQR